MSDIVPRSGAAPRPLNPRLCAEVQEWVKELRVIWGATGLSLNQFASMKPIDKGTVSRYLSGDRVPNGPWFLDELLDIQARSGQPVTPAVREHLKELHRCALEAAHPHAYQVQRVNDQLRIAVEGKLEAERCARVLEEQLAERNRRVSELAEDKSRLQTAWHADRAAMQADYDRLTREISETIDELYLAREEADEAKQRCLLLESAIERLEALAPTDEEDTSSRPRPSRKHRRAVSGWDSLTDSELKVAAFVEEGLSNPEIAARLMLSRRTVATHVSHILKKLDVTTRTDIARESVLRSFGPEDRPSSGQANWLRSRNRRNLQCEASVD